MSKEQRTAKYFGCKSSKYAELIIGKKVIKIIINITIKIFILIQTIY